MTATATTAAPMVRVQDLRKSFLQLDVLRGVSLTCNAGETICVIGPSGSGKSTLLRCINHLETPSSGLVLVNDELIGYEVRGKRLVSRKEADIERQRRDVGMVFQRFNLFPHLTALENVALAPQLVAGRSKREAYETARTQLRRVGLDDKRDAFARQLSGGQQQRVAIARALAMSPKVLLFDEPTSALDPELVGEVLAVMAELAREGMTMIVVTHELQFAREIGSRIVFMDEGLIVEEGPAEQVLGAPRHERTRSFISRIFTETPGEVEP